VLAVIALDGHQEAETPAGVCELIGIRLAGGVAAGVGNRLLTCGYVLACGTCTTETRHPTHCRALCKAVYEAACRVLDTQADRLSRLSSSLREDDTYVLLHTGATDTQCEAHCCAQQLPPCHKPAAAVMKHQEDRQQGPETTFSRTMHKAGW